METTRTCPQCQQPLSADAPDGLCPQCLMIAASGPPPSAAGVGIFGDIIDIGDPAEVAKKLPQFEILEMLGRGGMGVVYKARQLQLDRLVALKILPPVDALTPDFVARFTREARALAKLNHPNIVNVYDFGETGGLYYIVMEYVDGANLRQLLEARTLTPAEALAIVPKICDALEYAHEEGLVHRDIKPENLLIDKKGRVKIADFGLAKLLRREPLDMTLTLSGMALGTLRYMAPEQMDKPETVDHRADLYSLGVVIYEMLTGETPVGRFELPSQKAQVDVRFDEIVMHALEREPARRYQHASEVKTDVERVTSKPQSIPATAADPSSPSQTTAAEFRQQDAREILRTVMTILSVLSVVGIIAAIIGLARVLFPALRTDMELGPVASLGRDAFEFVGILVLSAMARFLLPKARRQGRDRLARINAASLIIVGALLTFACDRHWFGLAVPYWVGGIFALAAFVCFLMLRGKDVSAALRGRADPARPAESIASEVRDDVEKVMSKPQVAPLHSPPPVSPPATSELSSFVSFLRLLMWLVLVICAAVFFVFDTTPTAADRAAFLHSTVHIGAVQPWLHYGEEPYNHARFSVSFLTLSAGAGLCAVVVALALFSTRRRSAPDVRREVRRAAIGLLVSGIAGAVMTFAFTMMLINEGQWDKRLTGCIVGVALNVTFAVLATFVFRGALKMLHGEDYAASRRAALCSIFSFNIVSLPIGIWALVKLSNPEVKALFAKPAETSRPPSPAEPKRTRHLLSAILVLLCLFALFFGLSFQAKTGATAAGVTQIITVGALDPLYFKESGPSGFHTGFNFFSWSFFAVVVAGIAFGALWRIGREDQGKIPRDPAWWRDWWKQVGIWGGLLLIACIVRTVKDPAKVLQPPGDRTVSSQFTKLLGLSAEPTVRIDRSQIPAASTPGRTDYAYTFSGPPNHRLYVWLEWWKDGKLTIDNSFNSGFVPTRDEKVDARLHITLSDGKVAGPATDGKTRIDWAMSDYSLHGKSTGSWGDWRPDFFAGLGQMSSWGGVEKWAPKVGETITLLDVRGGRNSILSGPMTDEGLRAGHWEAAMVLKARFEPVPVSRLKTGPQQKANAYRPGEAEPTAASLRLAEQFEAELGPFVKESEVRWSIGEQLKKSPEKRAKIEQLLREMGVSFSPDEKPEELARKLEDITEKIPNAREAK